MTNLLRSMAGLCFLAMALSATAQTTLTTTENRVTTSTFYETTPTLGNDGAQDVVVYTSRELLNTGMFDQADIYYQPLLNGQADGRAVQVTAGLTDDVLNDVSGDYIVYTAFEDTTSLRGQIMLYSISRGQLRSLSGEPAFVRDPKIYGQYVVWLQGAPAATEVILYDLNTNISESIDGPTPPTFQVEIGSRFAVWASLEGDHDIRVRDFDLEADYAITATATTDERYPTSSGDWIAWEARDARSPTGRIEAYNGRTGELRVIVDDANANRLPNVDGNLIAWESDRSGNFDVWVHRFDTMETFQVTSDAGDQYLNDLYGDQIAYVDRRHGDEDIFVSTLQFTFPDPCEGLGGDADGDGVCDDDDNCPLVANVDQSDSDSDEVGNACDNCPSNANPIQQCLVDGDCIGVSNTCVTSSSLCSAQNNNDDDPLGDICDDDDDNDGWLDEVDNCPLVANNDQADADSDGLGDVCDDAFTNSTVVTDIINIGNDAVGVITAVNPPGGNGLIAKLTGDDGVVTIVDAAASAYEAGTIGSQTYLSELELALARLDAFDNQLAAKIRTGKINEPEATELTGMSASIRQAINGLIANAIP